MERVIVSRACQTIGIKQFYPEILGILIHRGTGIGRENRRVDVHTAWSRLNQPPRKRDAVLNCLPGLVSSADNEISDYGQDVVLSAKFYRSNSLFNLQLLIVLIEYGLVSRFNADLYAEEAAFHAFGQHVRMLADDIR